MVKLASSQLKKRYMREICYGTTVDNTDDYVCISENSDIMLLKTFYRTVVENFESIYLWFPTEQNQKRIENKFIPI